MLMAVSANVRNIAARPAFRGARLEVVDPGGKSILGMGCDKSGLGEPAGEDSLQFRLLSGVQFGPLPGEIEHIDGLRPLRVDQRNLDITAEVGEHRADEKEEAGAVLGGELEYGAVRRRGVVEAYLGGR